MINRVPCNIVQTWRFMQYNNENMGFGVMCTVRKVNIERKTINILNQKIT